MTNRLDGTEPEEVTVNLPGTYTVSLLYYAELQGLKIDHSILVKEGRSRGDTWLVSARDEVYGPMPLRDAFSMLLQGEPEISLLHETETANEAATWRKVTYAPWWSRPNIALLWTAAVGIVAALFGWMLVCLITPRWLSTPIQVLYWMIAVVAVFLLCIPAKLRLRIKDRVLKRTSKPPPGGGPEA